MSNTPDLPVLAMDFNTAPEVRFSYAAPEDAFWRRLLIHAVEKVTGQPKLRRHYANWSRNRLIGENIFEAGLRLLNLPLDFDRAAFDAIPQSGPLLVVANHPFGVADGLAISALLTRVRPDVKIMCHSLLCQPREAERYLLPVDFANTRTARKRSAETRKLAMNWLEQGHCITLFPGGGVATRQQPKQGPALELPWHSFAARLAATPATKVVPLFVHGENSTLFHAASQWSYALRVALLFRETLRRVGQPLRLEIGPARDGEALTRNVSRDVATSRLHAITMGLNPQAQPEALAYFQWPHQLGNSDVTSSA
jgi:putative hemolysin